MPQPFLSVVLSVPDDPHTFPKYLTDLNVSLQNIHHEILACHAADHTQTITRLFARQDLPSSLILVPSDTSEERSAPFPLWTGLQRARGDVMITLAYGVIPSQGLMQKMAKKIREDNAQVVLASPPTNTILTLSKRILRGIGIPVHNCTSLIRAYSKKFIHGFAPIRSGETAGLDYQLLSHADEQGNAIAEIPFMELSSPSSMSQLEVARWRRERIGPPSFVWCTWVLMFFVLLAYIATYGTQTPFFDDWQFIAVATGHRDLSLTWLWSQSNEHRVPGTRLLYLALWHLSRGDLRVVMRSITT